MKCLPLVAVGLLVAAAGCRRREAPPPAPLEVEVAPVVQKDVPVVSEWIGTLDGSVNADIRPKIEGYLLRQIYKEGQFVHTGARLFEIDPRQFRAALEQAQGAVGQAEAQLAKADEGRGALHAPRRGPRDQPAGARQRALRGARRRRRRSARRVAAVDQAALNLGWTQGHVAHRRRSWASRSRRWATS